MTQAQFVGGFSGVVPRKDPPTASSSFGSFDLKAYEHVSPPERERSEVITLFEELEFENESKHQYQQCLTAGSSLSFMCVWPCVEGLGFA